jgi:hypothetical protein
VLSSLQAHHRRIYLSEPRVLLRERGKATVGFRYWFDHADEPRSFSPSTSPEFAGPMMSAAS